MSLLQNSNAISEGGYPISNSLRFQSASSTWMSRTPSGVGTSNKIMTFSAWVKRGTFATLNGLFTGSGGTVDGIQFWNNNIDVFFNNGATRITTVAVYRDPSSFYHVVVAVDTTQSSAADRVRIYVNGSQVTSTTGTAPSQNYVFSWNQNNQQRFGTDGGSNFFDGYTAEVNVIDGQALTPSSFGETDVLTGQWVAKKYTGTYGTNGFYLPFSNGTSTTTLGYDSSGNSNNWTLNNFTRSAGVADCWMIDVPSGNGSVVGGTQPNSNYAVMNPLKTMGVAATITEGNQKVFYSGSTLLQILASMWLPTTGKFYWEYYVSSGTGLEMFLGLAKESVAIANAANPASLSYRSNGQIFNEAGSVVTTVSGYAPSDTIGIAVDIGAGTIQFFKNNVSQYTLSFTAGTNVVPSIGYDNTAGTKVVYANFGQRTFAYTPPTGFKALCTANLPAATIKKGNTVFDATLYSGNSSTQTVVNAAGFQPDMVWMKARSINYNNLLHDSSRGVTKLLIPNGTDAEQTVTDGITSFNSNGFSLGANGSYNQSTRTYVGWQWKVNGGTTVSNTNGSITSTVQANTAAGVSVVSFTAQSSGTATVGHGLGVAPKMIIVKSRNLVSDWSVYHEGAGNTKYLFLNSTIAATTNSTWWNNTSPTSSVFTLGTAFVGFGNDIAYCFAEIAGFSKFGSYTGNGSTDGTFVYTGFRPKFVMIKRTDTTGNWRLVDTIRTTFNATQNELYPNLANAEGTATYDILSNGFKMRETSADYNTSGGTYIYMAFAENPFANSNAR